MRINRLLRLFLVTLGAFAAQPAMADIFLQGRYTLSPEGHSDGFLFTAEVPEAVGAPMPVVWPEGCTQREMTRSTLAGRVRYGFTIECERPFGAMDEIQTPWRVDGGTFRSSLAGLSFERPVPADSNGVTIPVGREVGQPRTVPVLAKVFTTQGILHIWLGWDHLAFVFLICLLARGRHLIHLVTAFTIGHSISLAAAFLEFVKLPMPPVEAVIALSIAFMAREAWLGRGVVPDEASRRRQLLIVSSFGLLHGLGFASALGDLGVLHAERIPALFFFNIGVEIGQLLFVAVVAAIAYAARNSVWTPRFRMASIWAIGALGGFWMVERIAGFTIV